MIVRARIFRRRTVRTEKKILVSKLGQIMLGSVFFFHGELSYGKKSYRPSARRLSSLGDTIKATVWQTNRWQTPITNVHSSNYSLDWFPPTFAAKNYMKKAAKTVHASQGSRTR